MRVLYVLFFYLTAQTAQAQPMQTSAIVSAPLGYKIFCGRWPQECTPSAQKFVPDAISQDKWNELLTVNVQVNAMIWEMAEPEGQDEWKLISEQGSYPTGDCEEFVLLKRRMLVDRGWNPGGLLITTAWRTVDGTQVGHAILTVRTAEEDYILDNLTDEIFPWRQTPYEYVARQEELNPNWWRRVERDPVMVLLPPQN